MLRRPRSKRRRPFRSCSPRAPTRCNSDLWLDELASKRLEILKQAAGVSRVGFLWNPDHPDNELTKAERAAASLGVELKPLAVRGPADFDAAFSAATQARVDALYVVTSRLTLQNLGRIVNFAADNRLPLAG